MLNEYTHYYIIFAGLCAILLPLRLAHEEMVGMTVFYNRNLFRYMTWGHVYIGLIAAAIPLVNSLMVGLSTFYFMGWLQLRLNGINVFPRKKQ